MSAAEDAARPQLWSPDGDLSVAVDLRRLEEAKLVWRVTPRVYAAADTLDTREVRARAIRRELAQEGLTDAALSRVVIALETAVWIHCAPFRSRPGPGLPTSPAEREGADLDHGSTSTDVLPLPNGFHLVVPPSSHRFASTQIVTHEHLLSPAMVTELGGVAVTTPERTAADVARTLAPRSALKYLDALADSCGVTPRSVRSTLSAMRRQRGVPRARRTVHDWAATRQDASNGSLAKPRVADRNRDDAD